MGSYQKMKVTFFGALVCVFVSVQCSDVRLQENRIHTSKWQLPLLAAFSHWTKSDVPESQQGNLNDTTAAVISVNNTKSRFESNSRKFQERKLDLDPLMDDGNFLTDPEIDIRAESFPGNKVVFESSSDLIRSMYYINPKIVVESEKGPEPSQAQEVKEQPEKAKWSVLDLLTPSASIYSYNQEDHAAKTNNETEFTEFYEIPSPASTFSAREPPTMETSEKEDMNDESITFEAAPSTSGNNGSLDGSGNSNNTYRAIEQKVDETKEVEIFADKFKKRYQSRVDSSPKFVKEDSHLFEPQSENVNFGINNATLDNDNGKSSIYSMATLNYLSRNQKNNSIGNEKNNVQSQFPISPVHSEGLVNIRTLATASVIFIMALSALFAGTAPFWHGNFFQMPMNPSISPFPYELPLPFDRRQFSSFHSSPPLITHPGQEQSNGGVYYDSFPFNSGLRRKRSTH